MNDGAVFFQPWAGDHYRTVGFRGRKLLIVGEAHYCDWREDGQMVRHELGSDFTRECVQGAVNREPGAASFWRRIQNRVGGPEYQGKCAPAEFWHQVAFYNFVQSAVIGGPGARPTREQWTAAAPALRDVLATLEPDRVLFLGYALWPNVPPRSGAGAPISENGRTIPLEWFDVGDAQGYVTRTAHPRSGDFDRTLEPILDVFVRRDFQSEYGR